MKQNQRRRRQRKARLTVVPQERRIIDPNLSWFIVRTTPRGENRARTALHLKGFDTWLPRFHEKVVRRGAVRICERYLFVRYIFVGIDPAKLDFGFVTEADGVYRILGEPEPIRISSGLIQKIADRLTGPDARSVIKPEIAFEIGQLVKVEDGPFRSFMAHILEIMGNGRVRAGVNIFGRVTPVEFDPTELLAA